MERVTKREDVIAMSTLRSSNLQAGGSASGAWQAVHRLPRHFRQEILPWRPREADPGAGAAKCS